MYVPYVAARITSIYLVPGTGEHGVGIGKRECLMEELGSDTVELMWTIKQAIDPLDIMNPGKVGPSRPSIPAVLMPMVF